jgi:hypothetical protein
VPDADEARRQDVLQEEPREVLAGDGAVLGGIPVGAVFVAEGDGVAVVVGDPGVGQGDAVDVSGQISDDVRGAGEGCLGVDVPDLRCAAQEGQVLVELSEDLASTERAFELGQQLSAEELAKRLDWQEEAPRRRDPMRAIEGEAA